jgi:hypothetical protein
MPPGKLNMDKREGLTVIGFFAWPMIPIFLAVALFSSSCEKEPVYDVNEVQLLPDNASKTKVKTDQQYVSILYANLFQTALSSGDLFEVSQCIQSIGDKELAREVVISNYMNRPTVQLPSDADMRANLDTFIVQTYNRFLVRNPTEGERQYFKNYISTHPNVTPEMVYFSFALSDEYLYY